MSGWSGRVDLNRNAGIWNINAALRGVSPGFESNDLGYLSRDQFQFGPDLRSLFDARPDAVVLVTISYWFGRQGDAGHALVGNRLTAGPCSTYIRR